MAAAFTPETMRFLRGLARHNDREWFEARREVYERAVKQPLLALVEEINAEFAADAPEHLRPAHKTAMRIYRDVRFSPDKRPYKTHMAAWWGRRGLEKSSGAGYYLQIGPESSFVAAGAYAPDRDALLALRRWLAENHETYRRTLAPLLQPKRGLPAMQAVDAAALTRSPKGFAPDHPASDLLRARNWAISVPVENEAVLDAGLGRLIVAQLRRMVPFVEMLNGPLLARADAPAGTALFAPETGQTGRNRRKGT